MTKVYIVEGCKIRVETMLEETDKSFIIAHSGAQAGRYAHPKLRFSRHINKLCVHYANTNLATLDRDVAEHHALAQVAETIAYHSARAEAVDAIMLKNLELLGGSCRE